MSDIEVVKTLNSTYEIDYARDGIWVRRIEGVNKPTPNQGEDGVWQECKSVETLRVGESEVLLFVFADGKTTMSSAIQGFE